MKEGDIKTETFICERRVCDMCGEPAYFRLSYLVDNARSNPASSGYRGDDISWCSDEEKFACEEHKEKMVFEAPDGMHWCSTFSGEKYPHMVLYWKKHIATPITHDTK